MQSTTNQITAQQGMTQTIQPLETSVVAKVLVKDGDAVKAGQVLIELDATVANADQTSVTEQLKAAPVAIIEPPGIQCA